MAASASQAALAGKHARWQVSKRAAGPVREDLLGTEAWSRCCSSAWTSFILSFRVSQGGDLRRPVVDSVIDGTLAA